MSDSQAAAAALAATSRSRWSPTKAIKGQYIMLSPTSLKGNDTKKYIKDANLDLTSVGRILNNDDNELYEIRWIDAGKLIRDGFIDPDLLFKHDDFIFLNATAVKEDIKNRLWFEDPLEQPDVEPVNKNDPDLADLFDAMTFNNPPHPPPPPPQSLAEIHDINLPKITNLGTSPPPPPPPTRKGGKKSRKNRKLYKKSCKSRKAHKKSYKSRKAHKKSYKSRKAHKKSYKSRKAHKSRRRARR
jgi:hypothetical protein